MWQDWVLAVSGFGFAIALLPTVVGKHKPDWRTSLSTGLLLSLCIVAYVSLDLWKAVAASCLTTVLWFILLGQEIVRRRNKI
jgi:hypothetical protein